LTPVLTLTYFDAFFAHTVANRLLNRLRPCQSLTQSGQNGALPANAGAFPA